MRDNALFVSAAVRSTAYTAWSKTERGSKFFWSCDQKKPNPNAGKKIAKFRSIRDKNQTIQYKGTDKLYSLRHLALESGI